MPELPDVEVFKSYLDSTSLHQKISDVEVNSVKVLKSISGKKFAGKLKGASFTSSRRHGKNLFIGTDGDLSLVMHFGMTGGLKYFKDPDERTKYMRVVLAFDNGYRLGYISRRMLGGIGVIDSVDDYIAGEKLGPDAVSIGLDEFRELIKGSSGAIKSLLMNQNRIAGIGNVYSDEILFHSKLHPKLTAGELDDKQIKRLYNNMGKVLDKAVECRAEPSKLPRTYLTRHRKSGDKCPRCDSRIDTLKVSGRSAYYCPDCQKKS